MADKEQPAVIDKELKELHLMASELMATNAVDAQGIRTRMSNIISGGYDFADTLHNIYLDYGYPFQLEFSDFWNMYRRFGIAKNVIELPVNMTWKTPPIVEGSDEFNKALAKLDVRISLYDRMKGLDTRQRVGRYAGMFMRVKDDKDPKEPIEGKLEENSLVEMMPLYESQLEVITSDKDPKSDRFGQPIMLQYNMSAVGSRNEEATQNINIHFSRIVFAAEGADNGWIYGIPALEPVFNSLMDCRKIIGGAAEGFYRNASQSGIFNLTDPENATDATTSLLEKFNERYTAFNRDRMSKGFWTPGMEMKTLESNLSSPKEHFQAALNDVAAGSTPVIPATILVGQQTGRLASDEDSRHFLSGVQSRRENWTSEMVRDNIDWLLLLGILPASEYVVTWDDLLALSFQEKLKNSKVMAEVNKDQILSGDNLPFSSAEIREEAGFDPEETPDPGGEDDDDLEE